MATDTAAPVTSPAPVPPDPTRHIWQLPVLLLGTGLFVSAWQGWLPIGRADPKDALTRDIGELKTSYEKVTPDPADLKARLNKVAGGIEASPQQAPLARFHLGSGYARLAEITPALDEARGYWMLAHQHFELVTDRQLSDPNDVPRLMFRKAKAKAAVGLPPDAPVADVVLLATVLSTPPPGEEAGETHRLVADLAMRVNPPNILQAKLSLTQYLTATGIATPPASLARARLRLGDLYLYEKNYEEARKWLEQIGADAPPDVLAPAKSLLARVLMAEGNFPGAVKEWELLRGAPNVHPSLRLTAAYQLGACKLKLRETEAAARLFEEAAKGEGPEATGAAIQLADLHLRSPDPARHKIAADLLAGAVKGINKASDYDPTLVALNELQAAFEMALTTLLADGAHEHALKAAEAYAAVCAPGRDREKRAEVFGAWGESLKKKKGEDPKPKFKSAADEFAALAAFQPKPDGKLDMLRRAASYYRQANEHATAAARLEEALKLKDIPEPVLAPLWVELADALLAAGRTDGVLAIFNKVMTENTPLATATRYRLARQFTDSRHPGLVPLGRALFEQIAKQQNVSAAEREYHERALTELANALIRESNFADAETRLRTQIGLYPNGPEAGLAKLLLGVCLLQRAAAANVLPADGAKMRNEAVTTFKQLVAECDAAERRNGKLTEREAWLRLQAALRVLQTYQQMRMPKDLLFAAAALLERHRGTVEELIILSLVYHAFKQLNDPGKALDTRDRMRDVFDKLKPEAFTQPSGEYSRDYWLKVWFAPEKKE
jgi:tetratricopeptide (TPR) repeat protein